MAKLRSITFIIIFPGGGRRSLWLHRDAGNFGRRPGRARVIATITFLATDETQMNTDFSGKWDCDYAIPSAFGMTFTSLCVVRVDIFAFFARLFCGVAFI